MLWHGVVVSVLVLINEVAQHWDRLLLGWVTGKPSRYVTGHLGQLSLPSLHVMEIEYRFLAEVTMGCVYLCLVAGNIV